MEEGQDSSTPVARPVALALREGSQDSVGPCRGPKCLVGRALLFQTEAKLLLSLRPSLSFENGSDAGIKPTVCVDEAGS